MRYADQIMQIGISNGGYVTCYEVIAHGIPTVYLTRMIRDKVLTKLTNGVYLLDGYVEDETYTFFLQYKKAVFSRRTALYLNDMTNRRLEYIEANFPSNYNTAKISALRCHRVAGQLYEMGKTVVSTPFGHKVNSYNCERCICDLFYYDDFDIEEKSYAIKSVEKTKIDYDKMFAYAKQMKVLAQVKSVLEVL